jgi:uncharacterized membrane protein
MLEDLGVLPEGTFALAHATRGGTVCGESSTGPLGLSTHAWVWTREAGLMELDTPGTLQHSFSAANGCNGVGGVVGDGDNPAGTQIVGLRWQDGILSILPTLGAGMASALSINRAGESVGYAAAVPNGDLHAVFFTADGGLIDLHDPAQGRSSFARVLTDTGRIYGQLTTPTGARAFVTALHQPLTLLAPLQGDQETRIGGGNASGMAVGTSTRYGPTPYAVSTRAVLWEQGVPTPLLSLLTPPPAGWTLSEARGINDAGTIIGMGLLNGVRHGFALVPVPPPPETVPPTPEEKDLQPKDRPRERPRRR